MEVLNFAQIFKFSKFTTGKSETSVSVLFHISKLLNSYWGTLRFQSLRLLHTFNTLQIKERKYNKIKR